MSCCLPGSLQVISPLCLWEDVRFRHRCVFLSCLQNNTHLLSLFPPLFSFLSSCLVHLLCAHEACPLCCSWQQLIQKVRVCVYATVKVCARVTRFQKPVVIGESLQRIPASSLVAARAGDGGRRLVSRDGSWSRACQRLLVIVSVVRGDSSPADGRRHPSTSPWRVIPVLLGIRMLLRGKSKFSSQIKKKISSRGKAGTGGGSGLRGITDRRATPSLLSVKGKNIIIPHVIKCNPADNLKAPMSDRLTNKSDN